MKPAPFKYIAPATVDEAVGALAEHGDEAKVLAGGQSLVPMMAMRLATPSVLVDINRVAGLSGVRVEGAALTVGAMTRHREVAEFPGMARRCPMVAEGVGLIGHVAIRNRGTVGGSLAHADPAAEWGALALAMEGAFCVRGGDGERVIPAQDFFASHFMTALGAGEIIREVRLRMPQEGRPGGSAFLEVTRQEGDFAVAGVAVSLELAGDGAVSTARVALIGVGEVPVRSMLAESALMGWQGGGGAAAAAAEAVDAEIKPGDDAHASGWYRRRVAWVLVTRAAEMAWARARRARAGRAV